MKKSATKKKKTRSKKGTSRTAKKPPKVNLEALLCALVLVPNSYSRNRFYSLYENPEAVKVRRRATRLRSIIRQLLGSDDNEPGEIVGEQVLTDGRVLMRYRLDGIAYRRTTSLSALEAAVVRYALARGSGEDPSPDDRRLVERSLAELARDLDAG